LTGEKTKKQKFQRNKFQTGEIPNPKGGKFQSPKKSPRRSILEFGYLEPPSIPPQGEVWNLEFGIWNLIIWDFP